MPEQLKTPEQILAQRAKPAQILTLVAECARQTELQFQIASSVVTVSTVGYSEEVIADVSATLLGKKWQVTRNGDQLQLRRLAPTLAGEPSLAASGFSPQRTICIGERSCGTPIFRTVEAPAFDLPLDPPAFDRVLDTPVLQTVCIGERSCGTPIYGSPRA